MAALGAELVHETLRVDAGVGQVDDDARLVSSPPVGKESLRREKTAGGVAGRVQQGFDGGENLAVAIDDVHNRFTHNWRRRRAKCVRWRLECGLTWRQRADRRADSPFTAVMR